MFVNLELNSDSDLFPSWKCLCQFEVKAVEYELSWKLLVVLVRPVHVDYIFFSNELSVLEVVQCQHTELVLHYSEESGRLL